MTIGIQANLDALSKSIKAINKATKIDLGLNITNAINESMKDLRVAFKKNMPSSEIKEIRDRLKEATKVKIRFDLDQATNQLKTLGTQAIGVYASFKGLVSKPISASIDFNNAINEINRFSNFSTQELAVFKKDIWSLGKTNGVKLDDIIKTSELSAKLGIAKQDLKDFSQVALDMQVGLGLGVEQSTEIGNKLSKAFSLNTKELRTFLDETTSMSKSVGVSGQKILEVISSISSGAKAFGLSAKETSALSSAFLSVGLDSSEASSSINKFFTELNNIDNASEGFKRSLSKMGLDAQTLKEDIANNPQEAIKSLFVELNDLDDEERFGVISDIFGKKMANNINSAKDGIKAFEKALESSKDSAGALSKAVDRAAGDGFGDVVIQLSSAFKHLGVSIGNGFVPILKPIFEGIKNITNAISGFLDNHQWVATIGAMIGGGLIFVKTIGLLAMAFKPLGFLFFYPFQILQQSLMISDSRFKISTAILNVFRMSINGVKSSFMWLKDGIGNALFSLITFDFRLIKHNALMKLSILKAFSLKNAMFALVPSFKQAGGGVFLLARIIKTALLGIKIALISTGIGALFIGLGLLIAGVAWVVMKFWKPIKAFFGGFFQGIYEGIAPIREAFSNLWTSVKTAFSPLAPLFRKIFGEISNTQEELSTFAQAGLVVGKVIGGAISLIAKPFEWLIQIITLALDGVAKATNWIENSTLGKMIFGDENKAIDVNKTTNIKGSIDEVIAKQNENKAKMLSSISSNDNSRQINDYKTITINTNANPQAIASAINSYSYDDEL